MRATPSNLGPLGSVTADLRVALREVGHAWMVIGGLAVILQGYVRSTRDVDVCVLAPLGDLDRLLARLRDHGFRPRIQGAQEFAQVNRVLEHVSSGVPAGLSLAGVNFEEEALRHPDLKPVGRARLPVARVDDLFVYELIAGRPRDLEDWRQPAMLHDIDWDYVEPVVREAASVLEDDRPMENLRRLKEEG